MHAGLGELRKGGLGCVGEVRTGDNHGRGAVFQQVDFLGQGRIRSLDVVEQVRDCPCDAMALSLPGNHNRIHLFQRVYEAIVVRAEHFAFWSTA